MDKLVKTLDEVGLEKFITVHRFYLCMYTENPNQVAAVLKFDVHQIATISHSPDNYLKNEKLYALIQMKSQARDFLEALNKTGNKRLVHFVESALKNSPLPTQTLSSLFCSDVSVSIISVLLFLLFSYFYCTLEPKILFNIPEPFSDTDDFLIQLHKELQSSSYGGGLTSIPEVTVFFQVTIVSGPSGIGKTQTATRYYVKYRQFYNYVIWIDAGTENLLRNSFLKLADEIKIPVKNSEGKSKEIEEIVKDIYNKISQSRKSSLIVFDNATDYQSCRQFFPFSLHPDLTKPVILATSRNQKWTSPTVKIQILPQTFLTIDKIVAVSGDEPWFQENLVRYKQALAQNDTIHEGSHASSWSNQSQIPLCHSELDDFFSEVLGFYENLEKKQTKLPDPDPRKILLIKHNKASVLYDMSELQEASNIFHTVYEERKEMFGENDLDTIRSLDCIGMTLEKEGKFREALEIYKKVFEIRKANLGRDHSDSIQGKSTTKNREIFLFIGFVTVICIIYSSFYFYYVRPMN